MSRIALACLICASIVIVCAAQTVSIHDIQFTNDPTGNSPYAGSNVTTGGIVTGIGFTGQPIRYFIADRAGGLWSGIRVNDGQLRGHSVGDSISFTARVEESNGQTWLVNIVGGSFIHVPASGSVPPAMVASGDIDEPTEGVFVELNDVWVVSVNASDTTFVVTDGSGNANIARGWRTAYYPLVGDTLRYLRGIVAYSGGRFTVNPRNDLDFGFFGNRPPVITQVTHFPETPSTLQSDTVMAIIGDDESVAAAEIWYRFGSGEFVTTPLRDDGTGPDPVAGDGMYYGVIPAGPARTITQFYVRAVDNLGGAATSPADAPDETYEYLIRSASLTIFDLQYTGDRTGGTSPYDQQFVTVTGVVTGTEYGDQRDGFFMSDPGGGEWSGILVFGPSLTPALWDLVQVTGQVVDYSGSLTEFTSGASVSVLGTGSQIAPLRVRPAELSPVGSLPDSGEAYEGVLVEIGPCVVTNTEDYQTFQQFDVSGSEGTCTVINDFGFEYSPVEGDSFYFIRGCVSFIPPASFLGHIIAPRFDADLGYVDRRAPELVGATAMTDFGVNITFNERLSSEGIDNLSNYVVVDQTDPDHPVLSVTDAYIFSTGKILHLEFAQALIDTHGYRLEIAAISDTAGNVLQDITTFFGGPTYGEIIPIADIYNNYDYYESGDTTGTDTLRGIVNFVQDVTTSSGSRRISAYIQDNSGRGFSLSQSGAASTFPGIKRGNFIEITGNITVFDNTIQLGEFNGTADVRVLAENVPLPDPVIVRTGDYRLQRQLVRTSHPGYYGAGTWVQTSGTVYRVDENVGGGTNIQIDDGSGNLVVRIWNSMNLDSVFLNGHWLKLRELTGRHVHIAGPTSTFEGDFQMLGGYAEDFTTTLPDFVPEEPLQLEIGFAEKNRPFAPDIGQSVPISYNAPPGGAVRLRVFDLRGHLITTLIDKNAGGPNQVMWDGRDDRNNFVPLGTYILHLESIKDGTTDSKMKPLVVGTKL